MVALMDTLSIYEQFRAALGEEKAKVFAQTLGTMIEEAKNAATKDDIRSLRDTVDASAARVDATLATLAEAQARTDQQLDRLTTVVESLAHAQVQTEKRLDRLTQAVEKLAERMDQLTARVDTLAEGLKQLTARVDTLAEGLKQLTARVDTLAEGLKQLTAVVERLVIRSDRHEGTLLELKFRDRLPSYLGRYLRRAQVLQPADLLDEVEASLESAEVDDFLRADVLARGTVNGKPTYVVGEVSYTADAGDVERAARRAGLLKKASLPAVGLVACEAVHPETVAYAREQGVRIWADGVLLDERP
jgi:X-X-X-Leu-X-X-Gly heptad repeat protein